MSSLESRSEGHANGEEGEWLEETKTMRASDLLELRIRVEDEIRREGMPYLRGELEAGRYVVVGYGSKWKQSKDDETKIFSVQIPPRIEGEHAEIRRADLAQDLFPELWKLKRKSQWLVMRAGEVNRAEEIARRER